MHPFDAALDLKEIEVANGVGRYAGRTSPAYWNMVGPFGGYTAATVLAAVLKHPDLLGAPVSITVNFAAAVAEGDYEVQVHPARTNRSTQHWTATIVQKDKDGVPQITTTATAITAVRRSTWGEPEVLMPQVPKPAEVELMRNERGMAWFDQYELRPVCGRIPTVWDGRVSAESLSQVWVREQPPRPLGFTGLLACSDIFFPRIWLRRAHFTPAGTVTMTTYFHADEQQLQTHGDGWLLAQARGQAAYNGFCDQTAQLWSENGTLLATSHQVFYYKE